MLRTVLHGLIVCAGLALLVPGCNSKDSNSADDSSNDGGGLSNDSGTPDGEGPLSIVTWWVQPGEAEALQALINTYKDEYPKASPVKTSGSTNGGEGRALIHDTVTTEEAPDLFQYTSYRVPLLMAEFPKVVAPVDEIYEDKELKASIFPEIVNAVTLDGHKYSVSVGVHRENSVLYNKQIFADNDLDEPQSVAELLAACEKLKGEGITPIATAMLPWVQRIVFNQIAQGTLGAEMFRDWVTKETPITNSALKEKLYEAMDSYQTLVTEYFDLELASKPEYTSTLAMDAVHDGEAAMIFMGDWAKGYFLQLGWTPGTDFGQFGSPGADDFFWMTVDVFALPTKAPNPVSALDFLKVVASKEGQVAFNKFKGSTPIRADVRKDLDPLGKSTLDALINAKFRVPVVSHEEWDNAILQFANDGDKDALYEAFVTTAP